jgi:2-polyprenyl-3-methyl-5-hydroxy-6-metoxy-1,4-benzoquinol methylase
MKKSGEQGVSKYWDENAPLWAKQVRGQNDLYRELFNNHEFFKFIGDIKNKTVLDAGCGEGYNTRLLAQQGAKVIGIDIAEKMIALAKEEEEKCPLGIEYKIASFTDLSCVQDNLFDVVISTMALMDGPGYADAVKEFYRVLKPGGNLFFSVTHPCFITKDYYWLQDDDGEFRKLVVSHYFEEKPWCFTWKFSSMADTSHIQEFTSINYHRTMSTYVNKLIEAGFVLKRIKEPRPSEEVIRKLPKLKRAREHAGTFLYFHGVK